MAIIISDFLQDVFVEQESEALAKLLRYLNYRKQRTVLLHVLAGEELSVGLTGTKNLIDMEEKSVLSLTLMLPVSGSMTLLYRYLCLACDARVRKQAHIMQSVARRGRLTN